MIQIASKDILDTTETVKIWSKSHLFFLSIVITWQPTALDFCQVSRIDLPVIAPHQVVSPFVLLGEASK